ncbi:MAG: porin [Bacteroidia bacterium]|nr:porin [Bacteroidia bacterium]MDW8015436.1 porin [Bacteroidia bacterium]
MRQKWLIASLFSLASLLAQNESDEQALVRLTNQGISFSQDSSFLLNLRFRMQNRFGYLSQLDDTTAPGFDIRVRRLRVRLDGFILTPRLSYYIQLSFSAADQDFVEGFALNIVRDAMIYYTISRSFYLGFGQGKLPGNRQRVISSGNLQMPERSYASQFYTLDRDVGVFLYGILEAGKQQIRIKAALTGGEGRLSDLPNTALAYTGRIEYLPFGTFQNTGDYSEGDLEYELEPRLSLGLSYCMNQDAQRVGGQLGRPLNFPADIQTLIVDGVFKYRGWALSGEAFWRHVQSEHPTDPSIQSIYTGYAWNVQFSKVFWRRHEICLRYTEVNPLPSFHFLQAKWRSKGVGYSYYIKGHRVKAQLYGGLDDRSATRGAHSLRNRVSVIFQMEFGI